MPKDKELADQLDAEDRLRNRGYEKVTCPRCGGGYGGVGQIQPDIICWKCEGKGYLWEAPITK